MKPERWRQLETLYNQAVEMGEGQRQAFLRESCGNDEELRRELEELLASESEAADFMEKAALKEIVHEFAGASETPSWLGRQVGNYEFLSHIGAGGMGEVYRAHDRKLKREVAIKVLPEEFAEDPERVRRFRHEAELLASLNHPNIAAIYDLEEDNGSLLLILEMVGGETLADRLKRGPIPREEALKIALQIAEALEAAHQKNVIHRDLKPANIKVTSDGKVKVLDFGLAKVLEGDAASDAFNSAMPDVAATRHGVILGTAGYMSPEQTRGETVDRRADVWAFGCVLFEMLTGIGPYEGKTLSDVIAAVLKAEPHWHSLPNGLHPRILYLLERCLEKEPGDRCHSLADARVEIRKALADTRSVPAPTKTGSRFGPRSRIPWIAAATAVLASVLILTWRTTAPVQPLHLPFILPKGQELHNAPVSMVALSRDGKHLAYATGALYIHDFGEKPPRLIAGTEGIVSQPAFSPDAKWLAYTTGNPPGGAFALKKIPVSGGTPVTLIPESSKGVIDLTWTDHETIRYTSGKGILEVPADSGGTPTVLVAAKEGERLGSSTLLPGGKVLLFAAKNSGTPWDSAEIFAQRVGESERHLVWKGGADPRYISTGHVVFAQKNTLFMLPFDVNTLTPTGTPSVVVDGIQRSSIGASDTGKYAISDTGMLVYVPAIPSAPSDYVLALTDGSGNRRILHVQPRQYRHLRVSPNGEQLAVEILNADRRSSIWIYGLNERSEIHLLATQGGSNTNPIWTPDSKSVTFASDRDGTSSIYSQRVDSNAAELLVAGERGVLLEPESWAPLAGTLSFMKSTQSDISIWTYSTNTRTSQLFHDTPGFSDSGSSFSLDGKWVAFAVHTAQTPGIHVSRFPPTGESFQVTHQGERFPVWRGNGLYYQTRNGAQLIGVDVSAESGFTARDRRALDIPNTLTSRDGGQMSVNSRDYDVMPGGTQFLLIVPASPTPVPTTGSVINVVVNWFEELKGRR